LCFSSTASGAPASPRPAGELGGIGQADAGAVLQRHHQVLTVHGVQSRIGVRAGAQRRGAVQQAAGEGDHLAAAHRVIALGPCRRLDGVGAVERIIEAAPARIGGVQGVAAVGHRHHQLRAGDGGDFRIDVLGVDLEGRRLGQKVADLAQERGLFGHVQRLAAALAPPIVDLRLQVVATLQQLGVARREVGQHLFQRSPEGVGRYARARQQLAFHEGVQRVVDREGFADVHARPSPQQKRPCASPHCSEVDHSGALLHGSAPV
jgi:hypothetical protein